MWTRAIASRARSGAERQGAPGSVTTLVNVQLLVAAGLAADGSSITVRALISIKTWRAPL